MGRLSRFADQVMRTALLAEGYTSHYAHTSQGRLHYYQATGSGRLPPMVFLHGLSANATDLAPLYRLLRRRTQQIIGVDLPVHGWSDVPTDGILPDPMSQLFYEGMEQIIAPLGQIILFGNSLGGLGAIRYATRYPERVKVLVLSSPGGASVSPEQVRDLNHIFHHETQHQPHLFVERLYHKPPVYRRVVERIVQQRFSRPNLLELMSHIAGEQLFKPEDVQRLTVPTLLIWGQRDRLLENQLDFFKAHMPAHVEITEPHHFTHVPYLENPWELAHRLAYFALRHCPD